MAPNQVPVTNRSLTSLAKAMTELRRLTQDPRFEALEQALADLGGDPSQSDVSVRTVRRLRQWSAEYLRVAGELEAAARCCRLVEREVGERVDGLLAARAPAGRAARARDPGSRATRGGQHAAPGGWLQRTFDRFRARRQISGDAPMPARSGQGSLTVTLPRTGFDVAPTVPVADIAALALGPLEVHVAGRQVPRWNSLKARGVFQYLLIHQDRPTRRDVLMDLQWPDHTHNSARNNLNVALHNLRNTLDGLGEGVEPILYRDGCYSLNPGLTWWIDRNEFLSGLREAQLTQPGWPAVSAYHRAVQLYRGRCSRTTAPVTGTCPSSAASRTCTCRRWSGSRRSTSNSVTWVAQCTSASSLSSATRAVSPYTECSCAATRLSTSSSLSADNTAPALPPCATNLAFPPRKRRSSSSVHSLRHGKTGTYALNKRTAGDFARNNRRLCGASPAATAAARTLDEWPSSRPAVMARSA